MCKGRIVREFAMQGSACVITWENINDLESDYERYALYDEGVRKFAVIKRKHGTRDEGFLNSMILRYETEKGIVKI